MQGSELEIHVMSLFIKCGLRRLIVPYFLEDTFQDSNKGSFPCTRDLTLTGAMSVGANGMDDLEEHQNSEPAPGQPFYCNDWQHPQWGATI